MDAKDSNEVYTLVERLRALNRIGVTLSSEENTVRLLEKILTAAKRLTFADGGTLYTLSGDVLKFEIIMTDSLNIHMGGNSGTPIEFPPLPLRDENGEPNMHMVSVCAALTGHTVNTRDAYEEHRFDFSGTRAFDEKTGYRSTSFLTVPMKGPGDKTIGVLQLINAVIPGTKDVKEFTWFEQQLVEALASQAAVALHSHHLLDHQNHMLDSFKQLNDIGVALSAEKNPDKLLQSILEAARKFTHADGGTLYLKQGNGLKFEIMLSETLGIHQGGTSGVEIPFPPLPLYNKDGKENRHMVAVCAALTGRTINIEDAYANEEFDFSGTRAFDKKTGYRSTSFLTVPMKDHEGELIGVLQLLNATNKETKKTQAFNQQEQQLVESLASQAAVSLVNQRLLAEQKNLFDSFIQLIANAIDDKSPYTGGHCKRVPELTMMIADAIAKTDQGPEEIRQFTMSEDDRYELHVAGMLHDCGKITTKEFVVDKATKLETIFDRIHQVDTRFEVLKRDVEIALLKEQLEGLKNGIAVDDNVIRERRETLIAELEDDRAFIRRSNMGGEFMSDEAIAKVTQIGKRRWINPEGEACDLLSEDEIYNLSIRKGTLTDEERKHINYHIEATIHMLEALPYPKYLQRVPEYAGGHHEHMDGKGYPKGLVREQMSIQARAMGIADIFEALTASDRPYKKPMTLSFALTILGRMKLDNHIDPDIFDVFIREKIYMQYAEKYLPESQIDEVDLEKLPGYSPS